MGSAGKDRRRLMIQFGETVRQINRAVLNPVMEPLGPEQIEPVVSMVARARADYMQALMSLASQSSEAAAPTDVSDLRRAREVYEELVAAAGALETVIERGYLDVSSSVIRPEAPQLV